MQDKKLKDLFIVPVFFILCLYLYKDIIFLKGRVFSFLASDVFYFNFPFDYLTFGSAGNRQLSLWNPYIFLGEPLILHPASPLFYPLNLIFFLLPLGPALNYSLLLNTFLSGVAIYFYIRYLGNGRFGAFIGSLVFMFNAVVLLHSYAGHLPTLQTLPLLALLFLLSEIFLRKNKLAALIIAGLGLGIQLLAGNAQYTFYTVIVLAAYFLFVNYRGFMRSLLGYAALIAIGLSIAAIKLIPAWEFLRLSDRSVNDMAFVASWSLPARNLLTYFLPELYGDIIRFPYRGEYAFWEMCGYVGILPLILSAIAVIYRRNRYTLFFAGLSALALLAALGEQTPLFKMFYYLLPGFNKFRGHAKMMILVAFSVSILSAYGASWLLEESSRRKKDLKRIVWTLGIVALAAFSLIWIMKAPLPSLLFSLSKFSFFLSIIFLFLFLWLAGRLSPRVFKFFIFAAVLSDLWAFGAKYVVANDIKNCYWDRKIVSFLKGQGAPYTYRVMSPSIYGPFPNKALLDGIHMIYGYDAIFLRRYEDAFAAFLLQPLDSRRNVKLLSMMNLKFLVMPKGAKLKHSDLSIAYQTDDVVVWRNAASLPRAYIVHGAKVIDNYKDRLSYILLDEHFDPLRTVILEKTPAVSTVQSLTQQPGEAVEFLKYTNDEVIIRALLNSDGYLVLSDYNYPGWRADILNLKTGKREQVAPLYANNLFRAVGLTPGEYSVRFVFRPESFYAGCRVTALAVILAIFSLLWLKVKKKGYFK